MQNKNTNFMLLVKSTKYLSWVVSFMLYINYLWFRLWLWL